MTHGAVVARGSLALQLTCLTLILARAAIFHVPLILRLDKLPVGPVSVNLSAIRCVLDSFANSFTVLPGAHVRNAVRMHKFALSVRLAVRELPDVKVSTRICALASQGLAFFKESFNYDSTCCRFYALSMEHTVIPLPNVLFAIILLQVLLVGSFTIWFVIFVFADVR